MSRSRIPLLVAPLLVGCAHAAQPREPQPAPGSRGSPLAAAVEADRAEARALLVAQAEMVWRNWVLGDPMDLGQTAVSHQALFSPATVATVRLYEASCTDPSARRAATDLRLYLTGEVLGLRTAELSGEVATLEAEGTFPGPDGAEHPYRELERLLAGERDHQKRIALYDAAAAVVEKLNSLLQQKLDLEAEVLKELGYPSSQAFGAELRSADLAALVAQADDLLTRTDELYRAGMDRQLKTELGFGLLEMRRADVSRFNRSADLESFFPADKMVERLGETLRGLGIDLGKQPQLRVDDAPLPSKNPRALCVKVQVPSDVRLSVKPVGGVIDYRSLFHEAGHAEHYVNTQTPIFEFQQLGDAAASEAYALLFEGLIGNPLWLSDETGLSGPKLQDLVHAAAVKQLFALRRHAGKLLVSMASQDGGQGPAELYRKVLERASGFPMGALDARRYLLDQGEFLEDADALRAWLLAAQLEQVLVRRFGDRWWRSPEAGALLKSLWAEGNRWTAEEIAARLGEPGLRLEPLLLHFAFAIGGAGGAPSPRSLDEQKAASPATPPGRSEGSPEAH